MPRNFLITGAPGSGKTTVIEKVVSNLEEKGLTAGGVYCPELREGGRRQGFEIVDIMTGESKILAHVNQDQGPRVSKYRVNVPNVDDISERAISRALERADLLVMDEIAPMEVYSEEFRTQTRRALESENPLLAVIHKRSTSGFIGEIKRRGDTRIFEVNEQNRDSLPMELTEIILSGLN